ncbi:hypothetical protein NPIL_685191 [Nephila pilipes]|uniref:Uncharacterized protein n=1 Tax=Nephila pilipes TaxID=299642 RepID=A0A8X6QWG4_NEPPI|nr:hypothetical protein NPIL_685191 [Nephila pilipes]
MSYGKTHHKRCNSRVRLARSMYNRRYRSLYPKHALLGKTLAIESTSKMLENHKNEKKKGIRYASRYYPVEMIAQESEKGRETLQGVDS